MVPFDDRGLTVGDGLFETILAQDGDLVWWDAHVARLIAGCGVMGLPSPEPHALETAARAALDEADLSGARAAVRLTWTAGSGGRGLDRSAVMAPRLIATASPAALAVTPVRLTISEVRRNEGSPLSRLKTLSYGDNVLARTRARTRGADEAVMLNNRGELACAAAANLFWETDGRLQTPSLECGVLDGIARAQVLAAVARMGIETVEVAAQASALKDARAVFLTNSLIGVRPVSACDDVTYAPSPLAEALAAELT